MKIRKYQLLIVSIVLIISACKKEKDTDDEPSGSGTYHLTEHTSAPAPGNPGNLVYDYSVDITQLEPGWVSIHSGMASSPEWSQASTIPFDFKFDGEVVSKYKVSTSGVLSFDINAAAPKGENSTLPSSDIPDKSICVWGLSGSGANDNIVVKTFGNSSNRQHWIMFSSYSIHGGDCWTYWAIVLEENTNSIYIVDLYSKPSSPLHLTLGIQINKDKAIQASKSPNITTIDGSRFDELDNYYYEFKYK